MIGFYGFNPAQNPSTSRLFGPNIVSQGQQAFQQGYGQFKPFDEEDFAKQQAAAKAAALAAQQTKPASGVQGWNYAKQGFGGMSGFDAGMEARMIANLKRGKSIDYVAGGGMAGGKAPTREKRDSTNAFRLLAQQHGLI